MTVNRLIYLPLGGAGEIGMNCYVYGYGPEDRERLIVVDLGVTFPDMDSTPGVDLIMADISWLEQRRDRIEAIFITHAHEDHIGALGLLWPRLKVPVYARRFTAVLGKLKLEENGLPGHTITVVRPRPETVEAGPFRVQFVPVAHSIPESAALIIDTPAARIVHSGDFKLDETPLVGEGWNPDLFREIAAERPVKALMCDSTNVFSLHPGRSESTLREPIRALIAGASGMVVATTFASNVARLRTLAEAAQAAGRSICLLGRAMKKMVAAAQEAGVLTDFPDTLSPEEALEVPRNSLMLMGTVVTGFLRITTNPKIFRETDPLQDVIDFIDSLLSCPGVQFQPQGASWPHLRQVCLAQQATGNLITDAWIAATVMQSGETLCTFDRDFSGLLPADQLLLLKP